MSRFTKGFAFGLLTGATIGSIIAILYAPDKGDVTRDKLRFKLRSYLDDANQLMSKIKSQKQNLISEAKLQGPEVVADAQQKAEDLIFEAEELLKAIQQAKTS